MIVIKRDGSEAIFDSQKIYNAILGVNNDLSENQKISETDAKHLTDNVVHICSTFNRALNVEEIQDIVEHELMQHGYYEAAKQYVLYRYKRSIARQKNTTDDKILSLINCDNEEVKQENSNKNPTVVSVQRDYMAGEVSKDLCHRKLLPADVVSAHDNGIIHFHK